MQRVNTTLRPDKLSTAPSWVSLPLSHLPASGRFHLEPLPRPIKIPHRRCKDCDGGHTRAPAALGENKTASRSDSHPRYHPAASSFARCVARLTALINVTRSP